MCQWSATLKRKREKERERETDRQRERERDRQTDREREREREREMHVQLSPLILTVTSVNIYAQLDMCIVSAKACNSSFHIVGHMELSKLQVKVLAKWYHLLGQL